MIYEWFWNVLVQAVSKQSGDKISDISLAMRKSCLDFSFVTFLSGNMHMFYE